MQAQKLTAMNITKWDLSAVQQNVGKHKKNSLLIVKSKNNLFYLRIENAKEKAATKYLLNIYFVAGILYIENKK